jgi:hypothetical protein
MKNLASLFLALSIVSAGSVVFAQDATAPAAGAPAAAPKKAKKHHHAAKKKAAKPAADAAAPATK